jgi:uncharacterized membrane protein
MIPSAAPNDTRADPIPGPPPSAHGTWNVTRTRLIEGLFVVLPILVTLWLIRWMYSSLEQYVIEPLAGIVIWKGRWFQSEHELPYWFENVAAPIISIVLAVAIVYVCGVLAHTQFRKRLDGMLLKVPLVSQIYEATQGVLKCFETQSGPPVARRMVLVPFPHNGMRLPAIVTSTSTDVVTGKKLLCVYVPTTPVPASGFFLMLPEEEATELNWDVQQTLQTIISGGLTAPPKVTYFKAAPTAPVDDNPSSGAVPVAAADGARG